MTERTGFWEHGGETLVVIVLAIAGFVTAFASWQAGRWTAAVAANRAEAVTEMTAAQNEYRLAEQEYAADLAVFNEWVGAAAAGETDQAALFAERFSAPFATTFDAWIGAYADPLRDPEAPGFPEIPAYEQDLLGGQLEQEAARLEAEAETFGGHAAKFSFWTVILALVLLFAALADKVPSRRGGVFLLGMASVGLLTAIGFMSVLPKRLGGIW